MKCISTEYREELALKSPFEIYCDINSNELLDNDGSYKPDLETVSIVIPTQSDYQWQAGQEKNWQRFAKAEDKRVAEIYWRSKLEKIVTAKRASVKSSSDELIKNVGKFQRIIEFYQPG